MAGVIRISGIEASGRHGVLEEEKRRDQRFLVDIDMHLDLDQAASSDDIDATVDYGSVADAVHGYVEENSFDLIETLAAGIADLVLLGQDRVESVRVTVHKPEAPISVPFADVSVSLTRQR